MKKTKAKAPAKKKIARKKPRKIGKRELSYIAKQKNLSKKINRLKKEYEEITSKYPNTSTVITWRKSKKKVRSVINKLLEETRKVSSTYNKIVEKRIKVSKGKYKPRKYLKNVAISDQDLELIELQPNTEVDTYNAWNYNDFQKDVLKKLNEGYTFAGMDQEEEADKIAEAINDLFFELASGSNEAEEEEEIGEYPAVILLINNTTKDMSFSINYNTFQSKRNEGT